MNRKRRRKKARIEASNQSLPSLNLEAEVAIQAASSESGEASLPTVAINAYGGGTMRVGNYPQPVAVNVSGIEAGRVPLLKNHNRDAILGHGEASKQNGGIHVDGVLSASNSHVDEVRASSANGFPWQASIGLDPTKTRRLAAGKSAEVNGQMIHGPALIVEAGRLREVSLTPVGADSSTSAAIAAEYEDDMSDTQTTETVETPQPTTTVPPEPAAPTPVQATATGLDPYGEIERRQRYDSEVRTLLMQAVERQAITASRANELEREYAQSQPSIDRIRLELQESELQAMRDGRYRGQSGHGVSTDDPQQQAEIVECAFARACGIEAGYSDQIQQIAHDKYGSRGIGLAQLLHIAATANGYRGASWNVNREVLEFAMPPMLYAASSPSTYRVSGILSNIANKMIVDAFNAVESSWRSVAAVNPTRDFKEMSTFALTGDFTYKKVNPGGEITHAVAGEETYGNKADTYARLMGISRTDLINDDLGAFNRVRLKLGRGAALSLNEIFWAEFNALAASWWTAGRGNYFEGADSALDIDSLGTAEQLFRDQVDLDDNPLGVMPAILLVTNKNATNGRKLVNDTEMRVDGASARESYTTGNPWVGMFQLAISSYLGNAKFGGTADQWFLLANPLDLPTIEVVFLNGQQTPFIEQAAADFDQLGIQLRGYHDFGVRKQEYRASVRSKGSA